MPKAACDSLIPLRDRLRKELPNLKTLHDARIQAMTSTQSRSRLNDLQAEADRISGKIAGVNLAISYIEEELRWLDKADD